MIISKQNFSRAGGKTLYTGCDYYFLSTLGYSEKLFPSIPKKVYLGLYRFHAMTTPHWFKHDF